MSRPASELPRLFTAAEVAEALRCSTWWVQEQARRGRVPYCEVAGGYRFSAEHYAAIVRLLERQPTDPACSDPVDWRGGRGTSSSDVDIAASPIRLQARPPRRSRQAPAA